MRKYIPLLCVLAIGLHGCAHKQDPTLRAREQRAYPDPTQGTENSESQVYRTQTIAAPSAASPAAAATQAPQTNAPARQLKTPAPVHKAAPIQGATGTPNTGVPTANPGTTAR